MGKKGKQKKRITQNANGNSTTKDIKGRAPAFQEVSLLKDMKEKEELMKGSRVTKHAWLQSMKKEEMKFPHPDLFFPGEMKFRNTFGRCDPMKKKLPPLSQLLKRNLFSSSVGGDLLETPGTRRTSRQLTNAEERFLSYTEVMESDGLKFDRNRLQEMEASAADLVADEGMDMVSETLPVPFTQRRGSMASTYGYRRESLGYRRDSLGYRRDSLGYRRDSLSSYRSVGSVFTRQSSQRSIGSGFSRQSSQRSLDSRASIGSTASYGTYDPNQQYQNADDPSRRGEHDDGSYSSYESPNTTAREVASVGVEGPSIRDLFGDYGNDSRGRRWQQRCDMNELTEQELMEVEMGETEARRIRSRMAKKISEEDDGYNEDEYSSSSKRSLSELSRSRRSASTASYTNHAQAVPLLRSPDHAETPVYANSRNMLDESEAPEYDEDDDSDSRSIVSVSEEGSYSTRSSWTSASYYSNTRHNHSIASGKSSSLAHMRRRSLESGTSSSSVPQMRGRRRRRSDSDSELYSTPSSNSREVYSGHSNDYASSVFEESCKESVLSEEDREEELDTLDEILGDTRDTKRASFVVSNLGQSIASIEQGTDAVFMDDSEKSEDVVASLLNPVLSSEAKRVDTADGVENDLTAKDVPQSNIEVEASPPPDLGAPTATALFKSPVVISNENHKSSHSKLDPSLTVNTLQEAETQIDGGTKEIIAIDDSKDVSALAEHKSKDSEPVLALSSPSSIVSGVSDVSNMAVRNEPMNSSEQISLPPKTSLGVATEETLASLLKSQDNPNEHDDWATEQIPSLYATSALIKSPPDVTHDPYIPNDHLPPNTVGENASRFLSSDNLLKEPPHDISVDHHFEKFHAPPDSSGEDPVKVFSSDVGLKETPRDITVDRCFIEASPSDKPHSPAVASGDNAMTLVSADAELKEPPHESLVDLNSGEDHRLDTYRSPPNASGEDAMELISLDVPDEALDEKPTIQNSVEDSRLFTHSGAPAVGMSAVATLQDGTTSSSDHTQKIADPSSAMLLQAPFNSPAVAVTAVGTPKEETSHTLTNSRSIGNPRVECSLLRSTGEDDDVGALPATFSRRRVKGRGRSGMNVEDHRLDVPDRSVSFTTSTEARRKRKLPRGMAQLPSWWVESVPHLQNEKPDDVAQSTGKTNNQTPGTGKSTSERDTASLKRDGTEGGLKTKGVEADSITNTDRSVERRSVDTTSNSKIALPTGEGSESIAQSADPDVEPIMRGPDTDFPCKRPNNLPSRDSPNFEKKPGLIAAALAAVLDSPKEGEVAEGDPTPAEDMTQIEMPSLTPVRLLEETPSAVKSPTNTLRVLAPPAGKLGIEDEDAAPSLDRHSVQVAQTPESMAQNVLQENYAEPEHSMPHSDTILTEPASAKAKAAHSVGTSNKKREPENEHDTNTAHVMIRPIAAPVPKQTEFKPDEQCQSQPNVDVGESPFTGVDSKSDRPNSPNPVTLLSITGPALGTENPVVDRAQKEKLGEDLFASIIQRSESRRDLQKVLSEEPDKSDRFATRGNAFKFFSAKSEASLLHSKNQADISTSVDTPLPSHGQNEVFEEQQPVESQLDNNLSSVDGSDDGFPDDLGSRWKSSDGDDDVAITSKPTLECPPTEIDVGHSTLQKEGKSLVHVTTGPADRDLAQASDSMSSRWVIKSSEYSPTPEMQRKAAEESKNRRRRGSLGQRIKLGLVEEANATHLKKSAMAEKSFSTKKGVKSTAVGRALGSQSEGSRRKGWGRAPSENSATKKTPWYSGFMLWKKHTAETFDRGNGKIWSAEDDDSISEQSETASLADNRIGAGVDRKLWKKNVEEKETAKRRSSWSASSNRSITGESDSDFDFDASRRSRHSRGRSSRKGSRSSQASEPASELETDLDEFLKTGGLHLDRAIDEDEEQEPPELAEASDHFNLSATLVDKHDTTSTLEGEENELLPPVQSVSGYAVKIDGPDVFEELEMVAKSICSARDQIDCPRGDAHLKQVGFVKDVMRSDTAIKAETNDNLEDGEQARVESVAHALQEMSEPAYSEWDVGQDTAVSGDSSYNDWTMALKGSEPEPRMSSMDNVDRTDNLGHDGLMTVPLKDHSIPLADDSAAPRKLRKMQRRLSSDTLDSWQPPETLDIRSKQRELVKAKPGSVEKYKEMIARPKENLFREKQSRLDESNEKFIETPKFRPAESETQNITRGKDTKGSKGSKGGLTTPFDGALTRSPSSIKEANMSLTMWFIAVEQDVRQGVRNSKKIILPRITLYQRNRSRDTLPNLFEMEVEEVDVDVADDDSSISDLSAGERVAAENAIEEIDRRARYVDSDIDDFSVEIRLSLAPQVSREEETVEVFEDDSSVISYLEDEDDAIVSKQSSGATSRSAASLHQGSLSDELEITGPSH